MSSNSCQEHEFVSASIVDVLAAVDFDYEHPGTAGEIGEVGANGKLVGEVITAEFTSFQFKPKHPFRFIFGPSQRVASLCGFGVATTSRFGWFPPLRHRFAVTALPHVVRGEDGRRA